MQQHSSRSLFVCLAVALSLRLAFVFLGFPALQQRWHLREDGDGYGVIAASIRTGEYTDVARGPVYPAFVALAGSPLAVKVLQALLDTATCALIFLLASSLIAHPSSFAAWLWAVYPFTIWRVAFINKEIVLTFLLVGYLVVQLAAWRDGGWWRWIASGLVLGVINLCRPTFLPWPVLVLLIAWRWPERRRGTALLLVAMCAVILPWTIRNYRVTGGEWLPVATEQGGVGVFAGNYQPVLGAWEGPNKPQLLAAIEEVRRQHAGESAVQVDRAFYRAAVEEIAANPLKAAELVVRKCGRFWFLSAARREVVAGVLIQTIYLALAAVGLWRLRPWDARHSLLLGLMGYVMMIQSLSYADVRYSLPVMPLVCVFAGFWAARKTDATAAAATGKS